MGTGVVGFRDEIKRTEELQMNGFLTAVRAMLAGGAGDESGDISSYTIIIC